jgi:pimeloyl-ACP methyl ester carboxylesterase
MMGGDDQIVPIANGKFLNMLIPNAELHEIPDGGHLFLLSHAEECVEVLREFLGRPAVEARRKAA